MHKMNTDKRIEPKSGQESVWDYPRPPCIEDKAKHIQVVFNGKVIADTHRAKRVLETSHPPVYYIPPIDVNMQYLIPTSHSSWCEWKGKATYYAVTMGKKHVATGAWHYPQPKEAARYFKGYVAFWRGVKVDL